MPRIQKIKLSTNFKVDKKDLKFKFKLLLVKKPFFILFFLGLLIILSFYLIFFSNFFNVTSFSIEPRQVSCANVDDLKRKIDIEGVKILFIQENKLEEDIKKTFICIEALNLKKTLPNKVQVEVQERKARAVLNVIPKKPDLMINLTEATPSSQEAKLDFSINEASVSSKFLVDSSGFIFSDKIDSFQNLTNIYLAEEEIELGKQVKNQIIDSTLNVVNKLVNLSIPIVSIKVEKNAILVNADPKIALSLDKDILKQLASLQLILQKAKMNSGDLSLQKSSNPSKMNTNAIQLIDLRFDKPIIIYGKR